MGWIAKLKEKFGAKKEEVLPSPNAPTAFHLDRHKANKPSVPDFYSMEKMEIGLWARQNDISIDRRKTKESIINDIIENLKSKEK